MNLQIVEVRQFACTCFATITLCGVKCLDDIVQTARSTIHTYCHDIQTWLQLCAFVVGSARLAVSSPCRQVECSTCFQLAFYHDIKHLIAICVETQWIVQIGVCIHAQSAGAIIGVIVGLNHLNTQTLGYFRVPCRFCCVDICFFPCAVSGHLQHHLLQCTRQILIVGIFQHLCCSVILVTHVKFRARVVRKQYIECLIPSGELGRCWLSYICVECLCVDRHDRECQ